MFSTSRLTAFWLAKTVNSKEWYLKCYSFLSNRIFAKVNVIKGNTCINIYLVGSSRPFYLEFLIFCTNAHGSQELRNIRISLTPMLII